MSAEANEAKKKLLAVGGKVSNLLLETAPELVVQMANEAKNKAISPSPPEVDVKPPG